MKDTAQFRSELKALLDKWDCYITFDCGGDTYGINNEELSIRSNADDSPLFSTNDVCGHPGWTISGHDI